MGFKYNVNYLTNSISGTYILATKISLHVTIFFRRRILMHDFVSYAFATGYIDFITDKHMVPLYIGIQLVQMLNHYKCYVAYNGYNAGGRILLVHYSHVIRHTTWEIENGPTQVFFFKESYHREKRIFNIFNCSPCLFVTI